jgi:DNA-binding NarL/FixJ family response regulator
MIKFLSVDDHPLLREESRRRSTLSDMRLVADTTAGRTRKIPIAPPDLALIDLQMPALNDIEAIIGIPSEFPNA